MLNLTINERVASLCTGLRMGAGFIICDDGNSWLVFAGETISHQRFIALKEYAKLELIITDWRAQTLSTWANEGDLARVYIPKAATISWLRAMTDPCNDLDSPLKGPFQLANGAGSMVARIGLRLCKRAGLLPTIVIVPISSVDNYQLDRFSLTDLIDFLNRVPKLRLVSSAPVPLHINRDTRVHVFRPEDGGTEHYAIEVGHPLRQRPVLSRLHSACFTGDLLGSLKCDCGNQFRASLERIGTNGRGILLYMNQEGRGIGMVNKMRAYCLQEQGFDTVEANHRLGFADDERDFTIGVDILHILGFSVVRLMTNNPKKIAIMQAKGISVCERIPLKTTITAENQAYLATKALKSGHLL